MKYTDKKGRNIHIEYDDINDRIIATCNNKGIGFFEFKEIEGEFGQVSGYHLSNMNVDAEFQRAGIGTEMMRLAAKTHGKSFSKPGMNAVGGSLATSDGYYSLEGQAFIKYCINEGIIDCTEPSLEEEMYDYYE